MDRMGPFPTLSLSLMMGQGPQPLAQEEQPRLLAPRALVASHGSLGLPHPLARLRPLAPQRPPAGDPLPHPQPPRPSSSQTCSPAWMPWRISCQPRPPLTDSKNSKNFRSPLTVHQLRVFAVFSSSLLRASVQPPADPARQWICAARPAPAMLSAALPCPAHAPHAPPPPRLQNICRSLAGSPLASTAYHSAGASGTVSPASSETGWLSPRESRQHRTPELSEISEIEADLEQPSSPLVSPHSQPLYVHQSRRGSRAASPRTPAASSSAAPSSGGYSGGLPEVAITLEEDRALHSAPTLSMITSKGQVCLPDAGGAKGLATSATKEEAGPREPGVEIDLRPNLRVRVPAAAVDEFDMEQQTEAELEASFFQLHLPVRIWMVCLEVALSCRTPDLGAAGCMLL